MNKAAISFLSSAILESRPNNNGKNIDENRGCARVSNGNSADCVMCMYETEVVMVELRPLNMAFHSFISSVGGIGF